MLLLFLGRNGRGVKQDKENNAERKQLGEGWGSREGTKDKRKKKKKKEGETLFQAVKMNLHKFLFLFFEEYLHKSMGE